MFIPIFQEAALPELWILKENISAKAVRLRFAMHYSLEVVPHQFSYHCSANCPSHSKQGSRCMTEALDLQKYNPQHLRVHENLFGSTHALWLPTASTGAVWGAPPQVSPPVWGAHTLAGRSWATPISDSCVPLLLEITAHCVLCERLTFLSKTPPNPCLADAELTYIFLPRSVHLKAQQEAPVSLNCIFHLWSSN